MQQVQPREVAPTGVIARLRQLVPMRVLSYSGAQLLAERLAGSLLALYAIERMPVPTALVGDLPKIHVEVDRSMPTLTSGASVWDSQNSTWVITVNAWEPPTRQRFTVMHEFFHIVVHRHVERAGIFRRLSRKQIEAVADYFAGCMLVPKRELLRVWADGLQDADHLATHFAVSARAVEVRLDQVRLTGTGREFSDAAFSELQP